MARFTTQPLHTLDTRDRDTLIRTIIGEAGNQDAMGQEAVCAVILNRTVTRGEGWPTDISEVCTQNNGRYFQFETWANPGRLNRISQTSEQYLEVGAMVDRMYSRSFNDPTGGACFFMNEDIVLQRCGRLPGWLRNNRELLNSRYEIGDHTFYGGSAALRRQYRGIFELDTRPFTERVRDLPMELAEPSNEASPQPRTISEMERAFIPFINFISRAFTGRDAYSIFDTNPELAVDTSYNAVERRLVAEATARVSDAHATSERSVHAAIMRNPEAVRALQQALGVEVDGDFGPISRQRLSERTADGNEYVSIAEMQILFRRPNVNIRENGVA